MYRRNPDWGWEYAAAAGLTGLALLGVIVVVAVSVTLAFVTLKEIVKIFVDWGLRPSPIRQLLWIALAALLGSWLLAMILLQFEATATFGLYLPPWSFLAFIVTIEAADYYAGRNLPEPAEPNVEDVLGPWRFEDEPVEAGA